MLNSIKMNAVNQINKGTELYSEGDEITCLLMVMKGRVIADCKGVITILGSGSFIGLNDMFAGHALGNYTAESEATVYSFPVTDKTSIYKILDLNQDYRGLIVFSGSRHLLDVARTARELNLKSEELYLFIKEIYETYLTIGKNESLPCQDFVLASNLKQFENDIAIDNRRCDYYCEDAKISLECHKTYYQESREMAMFNVEEQVTLTNVMLLGCREASQYLEDTLYLIFNSGEQNLLTFYAKYAEELAGQGRHCPQDKVAAEVAKKIDEMIDAINRVEILFESKVGRKLKINRTKLEEIYEGTVSGKSVSRLKTEDVKQAEENTRQEAMQLAKTLKESLKQILEYSEWEEEKAGKLSAYIEEFAALEDRVSTEDSVRKLKRGIAELFYDLYEDVFVKSYNNKDVPFAVELFLNYSYIDERLLSEEQILSLCTIKQDAQSIPCHIFTIREWMTLIYECKRDPSKSEMDMDYAEMLRDLRKKGTISEADAKEFEVNPRKRLNYEIHNMFASNCRIVNGQISAFVPILYEEGLVLQTGNSWLSRAAVNDVINKMLSIDPTVFYRELMYVNKEAGIEREYIMKQVFPEIIMLPAVGVNGVMWQEITGKRRDTPGRLLLPMFFEGKLEDTMVKVLGRFRWELCRSVQGTAWNNIQIKSLTSEYSDYIQFFKKNRDLTEERKEKLKLQIQKAKGSVRETFALDYEMWIRNEYEGAIRLNKVARKLLATYCPFPKDKRKALAQQPIFDEAAARFERGLAKKIYELEMHYRGLEQEKIMIPVEMEETLTYYKEL